MNVENVEQAEVKLFNAIEGYGFIKTKDGDVFFHSAFTGKFICNGSDTPIFIRGGEERPFGAGTAVILEKELATKGWRAKGVAFLDTLNESLEAIDLRPQLRVLWKNSCVWEGKDQIACRGYLESMKDSNYVIELLDESNNWVEYTSD